MISLRGLHFPSQFSYTLFSLLASQVAQWYRIHLPMQETQEMQVRSLSHKDPLVEEMATHSNILAWEVPWKEEPGELQSMASQTVRQDFSD